MSNNSSSGSSSIIHGIGFLFHTNKFQQHQQQTVSRTLISHAQVKHHNLSAVLNGWCSITNRSISIPFLYNSISFHFALSENNSLVLFTNWHSDRSNERLNEWTSRHMNETIESTELQLLHFIWNKLCHKRFQFSFDKAIVWPNEANWFRQHTNQLEHTYKGYRIPE